MRLALLLASLATCGLCACESLPPVLDKLVPGSSGEKGPALHVGILLVEGVHGTDLVAAHEVFRHAAPHAEPRVTVFTVAPTRVPLSTSEGLWITPDHGFRSAPRIDVLVVPAAGYELERGSARQDLRTWLRERARRARFVLALGDGAFALAETGLLDGSRVTTSPRLRATLGARRPELLVLEELSFVHDGKLVTSAGGAPSYEAALYLTELLLDGEAARAAARELGLAWDLRAVDWFGPGSERSRGSGLAP